MSLFPAQDIVLSCGSFITAGTCVSFPYMHFQITIILQRTLCPFIGIGRNQFSSASTFVEPAREKYWTCPCGQKWAGHLFRISARGLLLRLACIDGCPAQAAEAKRSTDSAKELVITRRGFLYVGGRSEQVAGFPVSF